MSKYPESCEVCGDKAVLWARPEKVWRGWCSKPCQRKALAPPVTLNVQRVKP